MKYNAGLRLLVVMLGPFMGADPAAAQSEARFAFFRMPALGGEDSFSHGISENGLVVGEAFLPGNDFHATLWVDKEPFDLGTLGGTDSSALAVNGDGWIVGWSRLPNGRRGAFLWRDGRIENIGTLGGDGAQANAINESGEIVGWSEVVPGQGTLQHAFRWRAGVMEDLGTFEPERSSMAHGVNGHGDVVGVAGKNIPPAWVPRAFLWSDGNLVDLGSIDPDSWSEAHAINDLGHIVGFSRATPTRMHATLWANGRIYDLGTPRTQESLAYDINNAGQVVGIGNTGFSVIRAFLWEQGRGMQRLDELAPPRLRSIGGLKYAWEINDAGEIAGTAYPPGDIVAGIAFLMTPIDATMEMLAPSPGRAGEVNTLTVTNATPGARVTFLYSRFGGGTRIPGCDLQQNALQLDQPTIIGTAIADGNGTATITRTVPFIARGQTILFQAVVPSECAISQLVVHEFE